MASDLPRALRTGSLSLGGDSLDCYVVETHGIVRRLISQRGVLAHMEVTGRAREMAKSPMGKDTSIISQLAESIRTMLPEEVRAKFPPIVPVLFRHPTKSIVVTGIASDDIVNLCDLIMEASETGVLIGAQARFARRASQIMRACAKVGLTALIDEATGYQVERGDRDLQVIFDRLLALKPRPWEKRFPHEFFARVCTLTGRDFDPGNPAAGLAFVVRDLVYDRLAPNIREVLEGLNPVDENTGRRGRKHHQHLTEGEGLKLLDEHLRVLVSLLRGAYNWDDFMRLVNHALPRSGSQMSLPTGPGGRA